MGIEYTREQQQVIHQRGCNVLVSAAAGSGKTAVLVERIIQMVCNEEQPVDIDRLLIVTFTNAAAAEMRERIAAGIAAKLEEYPESEHIQRQSTLLHNAQITTIDSFCLFLIRNHFNEIGLDPAFRVADEGEIKLLQQEVLGELLEEWFGKEDPEFYHMVEYFCPGGREKVLEEHILQLSRYASSFPWPQQWLQERKADFSAADVDQLLNSDYGRYLRNHVKKLLQGVSRKLLQVQALCQEPDGPYMYGEVIDNEIDRLSDVLRGEDFQEIGLRLETMKFDRLSSAKDDTVSVQKRELAKQLRNDGKALIKEILDSLYATPLSLAVEQGKACASPISCLIDLVLEFNQRMQEKKQERRMLDFSDMEHYALKILLKEQADEQGRMIHVPSDVAVEYRQFFAEILIDEYQDSNYVQELLLSTISGETDGVYNRFMVGDMKQSIYKFRLAEPEIFLEKYHHYGTDGKQVRIDLAKNFRSRSRVVDTVNQVFERMMNRETGSLEYDERARLYVGADYPENADCESELLLVEKPAKDRELDGREAEALAVARRIQDLMQGFQVMDKQTKELRPVRYSDMVILLRTTSGWDETFKKVLEQQGIPVYISSKTGYFSAMEVQELLQLLRVVDNPRQDLPLFGVMKSVFGGFTDEEIAVLRAGNRKGSFYQTLEKIAEGDGKQETDEADFAYSAEKKQLVSSGLREKVRGFLEQISIYRQYQTYMPIRELLQRMINDYEYENYVTALPGGSKRRANIEMLLTKASDYAKTSYCGLFHFVKYMEQLEKYEVDYGEADILDEHADVVRIMSIHKSKGLEFPVAFVCGLGKKFNVQDTTQALIVDMKLGLACDYINPQSRIRNKSFRKLAVSRKMREDNLAEELRVLYVALTRAKEKLILTGCMGKAAEKWEVASQRADLPLGYLDFYSATGYLDLLLPILPHVDLQVRMVDEGELYGAKVQDQGGLLQRREQLKHSPALAVKEELQQLKEQLSYEYPHQNLAKLYTKTTVSELKIAAMAQQDEAAYHAFEERELVPFIPRFIEEKETVSGTVRGNAYHRAMELLDFQVVMGACMEFPGDYAGYLQHFEERRVWQALETFLREKVQTGRLTAQYYDALRLHKLIAFLHSHLAYRMWAAQRREELYREQPFVYGVDASRLGVEFPKGETVLIQGIIDVFFIENGEIVLLDYKTDKVDSMQQLHGRYDTQLDYYEEAVSSLMELPVKEKILYSFYLESYER